VRGADGDQPDPRRDGLDHQPLGVDRHRDHLGPERRQQPPQRAVPGRLHRDPVAGLQQDPGHQVDRLLGAVGDHHLPGDGLHPAGHADVAGDGPAQVRVTGRVAVDAAGHRGRTQLLGQQPPPGLVGEQPGVGDARAEVELGQPLLDHPGDGDRLPQRPRPQRAPGRPGLAGRAGDRLADEGPGACPRRDEPLAGEPVVGDRHGGARDTQAPGQLPGRRQAGARRQAAVEDGPAQLPVDLAGQVLAADQADVDLHLRRLSRWSRPAGRPPTAAASRSRTPAPPPRPRRPGRPAGRRVRGRGRR
jgi:hypothetical protein